MGAEMVASQPPDKREQYAKAYQAINRELKNVSPEAEVSQDGGALDTVFDDLLGRHDFPSEYQEWYSLALRVVEQLLPDRYPEFKEFYRAARRKEIDIETYSIANYIAGIRMTRVYDNEPAFNAASVAMNKFGQQISIVGTAEQRLNSVLNDIGQTLHAEILDNELDAARNLLTASHLRSAGVVAGVVLEGHLKKLITDHSVTFRKKPMLSNLNDALKEAGVYDGPRWRNIQYLTDIRNICGHKDERDPERSQVVELIDGVARITKTLF
jgi:hypothetical protein